MKNKSTASTRQRQKVLLREKGQNYDALAVVIKSLRVQSVVQSNLLNCRQTRYRMQAKLNLVAIKRKSNPK